MELNCNSLLQLQVHACCLVCVQHIHVEIYTSYLNTSEIINLRPVANPNSQAIDYSLPGNFDIPDRNIRLLTLSNKLTAYM